MIILQVILVMLGFGQPMKVSTVKRCATIENCTVTVYVSEIVEITPNK